MVSPFPNFSPRSLPNRFLTRRFRPPTARRRGVALIYTALGLVGFMGITALVVDMGSLYTRRAQAQRAADAAALAGAYDLANPATAGTTAIEYAKLNGYDIAAGAIVTPRTYAEAGSAIPNRIEVIVQRREPLYFLPAMAALLGENTTTSLVGARAVAEVVFGSKPLDISTTGGAEYGSASGFANPSVFGPDSRYEYGDAYSPKFRQPNSTDANIGFKGDPAGADFPGYEYSFDISKDYLALNGDKSATGEVQLEIYDPDCYVADPINSLADWDEIHVASQGENLAPTVTQYTLLRPKKSEDEPQSARVIAQATYGGGAEGQKTNLKWTTPEGFKFNINDNENGGPGRYSLIVKSLEGASENGFQLRAGPPHDGLDTQADFDTWKKEYNNDGKGNGTAFGAVGKTAFNFTTSGQVKIALGAVPTNATALFIDKFDTDVGATSVTYSYETADGQSYGSYPGVLSKNGQWNSPPDRIEIPSSYAADCGAKDSAVWYATYNAAAYDTSTWKINYSTGGPGKNPNVRLVD